MTTIIIIHTYSGGPRQLKDAIFQHSPLQIGLDLCHVSLIDHHSLRLSLHQLFCPSYDDFRPPGYPGYLLDHSRFPVVNGPHIFAIICSLSSQWLVSFVLLLSRSSPKVRVRHSSPFWLLSTRRPSRLNSLPKTNGTRHIYTTTLSDQIYDVSRSTYQQPLVKVKPVISFVARTERFLIVTEFKCHTNACLITNLVLSF
jgi:hypothetical protein